MLTKTDIEKYFIAEKQESLFFIIIGLVAVCIALIGLFIYKTQAFKGAAIPLIVIGLMQIVVGFSVYKRSDDDRMRVVYAYDMNRNDIKNTELPRMKVVNKNFAIYRWIEIMLATSGLICIFYNKYFTSQVASENVHYSFSYGLGLALALLAVIMLGADYFAEKRAIIYTNQLQNFIEKKSNI
ncbi:MAG: hypothetical protein H7068_04645 [Pedobacter sp.]|nr:hypothetical protein [Chitinophagaceae bacterium]